MSLYRKYRPLDFDSLLGQNHIREILQNAVKQNRISHAYLFTGPRGTGKTSTARILARSINCPNLKEGSPCNSCEICIAALEERLTDLIEIDAASHGLVDDARALVEQAKFMPVQARKKIYIIDEVHMLSKSAFNALLKIIEEPPDHVHFILATTEAHKVPETIQSRCQRFDFHLADDQLIASHLAQVCQWEGVSPDDQALDLVACHGKGSFRDALSLLSQVIGFGNFTLEHVTATLGLSNQVSVLAFVEAIQQSDRVSALKIIHEQHEEGHDLYSFCQAILGHLRKLLLSSKAPEEELKILNWVEIFFEALDYLRDPLIPELPLEIAVMKAMAGSSKAVELQLEKKIERQAFEPKSEVVKSVPVEKTPELTSFVDKIEHGSLRRLLKFSRLEFFGQELKITASSEFEMKKIRTSENVQILHDQMKSHFGEKVFLTFAVTEKPIHSGLRKEDVSAVFRA